MKKITVLLILLFNITFYSDAQKILYDNTHSEQAGNADWIPDANAQIPSPAQSGITGNPFPNPTGDVDTYWSGALSMWGIEMAKRGYTIETLPSSGSITYGDGGNSQDLSNYDIFVVCEPNDPFTSAEKTAILTFVQNGGGLFMVADHPIADRNSNGWPAVKVWNDLMTGDPFGIQFSLTDDLNETPSTNIANLLNDPLLHGVAGDVDGVEFHGGASMAVSTANNASVIAVAYKTGVSNSGTSGVMCAYAIYGSGRVVGLGDSSAAEDDTPNGGTTYTGWIQPIGGSVDMDNGRLITNATIWLAAAPTGPTLSSTPTSLTGLDYVTGSGPSTSQTISVSGSNLDGTQSTVTAPANFEVSLDNTIFTASVNISYTAPTLNSTTVYIRLKSGLAVNPYSGNVVLSHDGTAIDVNIAVSGNVTSGAASTCEDFDTGLAASYTTGIQTLASGDWYTVSVFAEAAADARGGNGSAARINDDTSGASLRTPALNTVGTVDFYYRELNSGGGTFDVQTSPDNSTWTTVASQAFSGNTYTYYSIDINDASNPVYVRILNDNNPGHLLIDDFCWTAYSSATPTLTVTPSTLTGFSYILGSGPSTEQTFVLSGTNLDGTDVTLTSPTDYEISKSSGSGFTSGTITYAAYDGTNQTVYVRLAAGLAVNTYNGQTISIAGGGDTDGASVTPIDGEVTAVPVPTLSVSPSTLTGFTYVVGSGPSAEQTVVLSGTNLDGTDVTLTSPTDYEISKSSGSGFTSGPLTYTAYDGTNQTVYVRLAAGLAVNTYNGQSISIAGGGDADGESVTPIDGEVTAVPVGGCAVDLIISEYYEGASNDKYIEIYNGTGNSIALSDYKISIYTNGNSSPNNPEILLNAVNLADGITWIVANSSANATILGNADQTSGSLTFNGNDAVALRTTGDALVDVIGVIGTDPGSEWGSGVTSTADNMLVRMATVISGDTNGADAFDPSIEWDGYANGDFSYMGSHTMTCACETPTTEASNILFSNIASTSLTVSWTNGDGLNRIVVAKQGSAPDWTPVDANTYTANSSFGSGAELGTGNYVVYNGSSNTVDITNLNSETTYYFEIFEYGCSTGTEDYLTSGTPANGSQATLAVPVITVTGSLSDFGTVCVGSSSSSSSYSVSATDLSTDLTVTAPSGFQISLDNVDFSVNPITLIQSGGTVNSTTIYTRFTPSSSGAASGNISHLSTGATTINQAVSGNGNDVPVLTSTAISSITGTTASSGGNVTSINNAVLSSKGVCWNTIGTPVITDFKTDDTAQGTGIGTYTSALTGLSAGTVYYVRAYATNVCGVSYGNELSFMTLKNEPADFPSNFACNTNIASSAMDLTWTDASTSVIPDGYLLKWGISYASINDPIDGTLEADDVVTTGSGIKNISQGNGIYTVTNLLPATDYYFKIWSYTNSGTDINYKLISEPQTSCTTTAGPSIFKYQGFNSLPKDNWTYSSGGTASTDSKGQTDTHSLKMINGDFLTMDNVDISAYTNVTFSLRFAATGVNTANELNLTVSYDGGSTWVKAISGVNDYFAQGYSGATYNFGYTNPDNPYCPENPFVINIPAGSTQFTAKLQGSSTYYIDDVQLMGNFEPLTITTLNFAGATQTTAIVNAELEYLGGETVTERGIVFGTSTLPTVADNKYADGSLTTGYYTANLSGLTLGTTYYTRAYVITVESGTVYGNELSFTTCDGTGECQNNTDLIISEYIESSGGGTNNAIEIFNGTGCDVNLKHYRLQHDNSGSYDTYNSMYDFGDVIVPNGQTYVVSNSASVAPELQLIADGGHANVMNSVLSISGDEQFQLLKNGTTIEHVGYEANWGEVKTFCRNPDILVPRIQTGAGDATDLTCDPNTNGEWILFPDNYYDDLGVFRLPFDWQGDVSDDWYDPNNWNLSKVPTRSAGSSISDVTVGGNQLPVIGNSLVNGIATAYNITISAGASLTVNPDGEITITGGITNNAGSGGLILKSDATGTGSLLLTGGSSNATVENYLTGNVWHLVFNPFSTMDKTKYPGFLYYYDETVSDFWNSTTSFGSTQQANINTGWIQANSVIGTNYGYYDFPAVNTTAQLSDNTGVLRTQDIEFNINHTTSSGTIPTVGTDLSGNTYVGCINDWTIYDGWNLIGNPYTCAVDWMAIPNDDDIENGIYMWDASGSNYKYLMNGGTAETSIAINVDGSTDANIQYIPAGQAFFVKAKAISVDGKFTIPASARTHTTHTFWKGEKQHINNLLRFSVSQNDFSDETVVWQNKNSTFNHDGDFDLYKRFSMDISKPQIYTFNDNGNMFALNTFPDIRENLQIPVGISIGLPGAYTLNFTENTFKNVHIYLEDVYLGKTLNLRKNTVYNFTEIPGLITDRFIIHFENNTAPVLNYEIPDQECIINEVFLYNLPQSVFSDINFEDELFFTVSLEDGSELPDWLTFDSVENKFIGTPSETQTLSIKVTATDIFGGTVSDVFKLSVHSTSDVSEINENHVYIYPNPSEGIFTINFDKPVRAIITVNDISGKILKVKNTVLKKTNINLTGYSKGIYILSIRTDNKFLKKRIIIK